MYKEYDKNILKKLQSNQLDILKDFIEICKKYNLTYFMVFGSALGATRHNGFIPWDDDVDVIMSRSEYERFFSEAASDFDEACYFVQREHSAHWPMPYAKLRRNNTTCIEKNAYRLNTASHNIMKKSDLLDR